MPHLQRWTRDQVLLLDRLGPYLQAHGLGRVMTSPADLRLDGHQVAQPDIFVLPGRTLPLTWDAAPLPVLAIEVSSPSSARQDRTFKRRHYQRAGVPQFWVVDPDARLIEHWRPADERPEVFDGDMTWQPAAELPSLVIDLPAMFAELWGDR